jgi:hypothetical protein
MVPMVLWKSGSTFSMLLKIYWLQKFESKNVEDLLQKFEVKNASYVCKKENRFAGENFNIWTRRGAGQDMIYSKGSQ